MDFDEFLRIYPNAKFADYYVYKLKSIITEGKTHGALGKSLSQNGKPIPFESAGEPEFQQYLKWFELKPEQRVIDYGCGSFRLGLHFIRYLNRGNYFGLDLTDDFIKPGLERLNEILGNNWDAQIGTIPDRFDDAVNHEADFIVSSNVAYHVHPDECQAYYNRLSRLAHMPGSILCFDSRVALEQVKFGDRNWAFTFDFHLDALPDFQLVKISPSRERIVQLTEKNGLARVIFQFVRN